MMPDATEGEVRAFRVSIKARTRLSETEVIRLAVRAADGLGRDGLDLARAGKVRPQEGAPKGEGKRVLAAALSLYTDEKLSLYRELNERLRAATEMELSWAGLRGVVRGCAGELAAYAELLLEGLFEERPPGSRVTTLYRGVPLPAEAVEAFRANTGRFCVFPAFTSFSARMGPEVRSFAMRRAPPGAVPVIFELEWSDRPFIRAFAGALAASEQEVLLHAGSVVKIVRVRDGGKETIIELQDVKLP